MKFLRTVRKNKVRLMSDMNKLDEEKGKLKDWGKDLQARENQLEIQKG